MNLTQILNIKFWFCLCLILVPPLCTLAQNTSNPIISNINIEIMATSVNKVHFVNMAKDLIYLEPDKNFSEKNLYNSIEALKNSKLFKRIHVPDPEFGKSEIAITFQLTPFYRIKDIKIKGGFPLFEREILNAMTIYAGDEFNPKVIEKQKSAIEQLFKNEGYINPKAHISTTQDSDGNYLIYIDIKKGDFYKIKNVEIKGNDSFSSARLKLKTSTWKDSLCFGGIKRFVQKDLDEDVKKLTQFYQKKMYADVEIQASAQKDKIKKQVNIFININEGLKYDIEFDGNKEFWDLTLKKDLVLAKKGNKNDLGIRKSIRNIKQRYNKAGYPDISIKIEDNIVKDKPPKKRRLKLIINEGTRCIVDDVKLDGNQIFEDKKVKKQILTHKPGIFSDGEFVPEVLEEDKSAIKSLYLKKGYKETKVKEKIKWRKDKEKDKKFAHVSFDINEGVQTLVQSVIFNQLNILTHAEALEAIALKQGEPFREYMLESDVNAISAIISEKGHPHVKVEPEVIISNDKTRADITYDIDEGPYVEMGKVYVTGNFRTKDKIILNELELIEGEPFSLTKMLETNRNIRNINALKSADFKVLGLKEKADKINILVNAEEKKPYFIQFSGGYDTRRHMYVSVKAGDHNLFGLNKDVWVSTELSQIGYKGELGLTEPRFFGSRISSTANLFAEELEEFNKDFGTRTYGSSLGFDRKFFKYFTARLGFKYEYREQYLTEDKFIAPEDEDQYEPRSILVTTPALIYNSTDSFIRPKKGIFSTLSLDISKGLGDTLDDFLKYRFETRYYYSPLDKLTFALRGRYGYIAPFGSESSVPDDQLFFLGGTSDVRGFDENRLRFDSTGDPDGGRNEILGSIEARIDLGLNFELTTFYDIGSIRQVSDSDDSDDFRSSAGAGLRYITPIGPVGFLYGWNLDRKDGESSGKLHFTLGYTF